MFEILRSSKIYFALFHIYIAIFDSIYLKWNILPEMKKKRIKTILEMVCVNGDGNKVKQFNYIKGSSKSVIEFSICSIED